MELGTITYNENQGLGYVFGDFNQGQFPTDYLGGREDTNNPGNTTVIPKPPNTRPVKPSQPRETTQPNKPNKPVKPAKPVDVVLDPPKPQQPTKPVKPVKPNKPTKPVLEVTKPTLQVNPKPIDQGPVEPTKPETRTFDIAGYKLNSMQLFGGALLVSFATYQIYKKYKNS